jgi:hypothetical protein
MPPRVSIERRPDLLEESIEGSVARGCIALLDIDLDLNCMLVVGVPEAAERLLGLARITIAQDYQPGFRELLGQHAVAFDGGAGDCLEQRLERVQHLLGLARRHRLIPPGVAARSAPATVRTSARLPG